MASSNKVDTSNLASLDCAHVFNVRLADSLTNLMSEPHCFLL